ncbi:MAG TPA: hypothetical protein P5121_38855 [Caldilineaceae bacterium]|nr:hypothetical protein [Caldilineaceae bacterium]
MTAPVLTESLHLYHYYEGRLGPFRNLSDLAVEEAEAVLTAIRQANRTFAAQRAPDYLTVRRALEDRVRALFIAKGGAPRRVRPHYFTVGACPWLLDWYVEGCVLRLPLSDITPEIISFTYGDTFPAMRLQDGRPHRGQVYTVTELPALIERYGLPQQWNPAGQAGPDRYVEAQLWDDQPVQPFLE